MDPTTVIVLAVGAAVLGGGAFMFWRRRGPVEEEVLHFACPGCRRRLRFRPRQSGHKGQCPRCKAELTFPVIKKP